MTFAAQRNGRSWRGGSRLECKAGEDQPDGFAARVRAPSVRREETDA